MKKLLLTGFEPFLTHPINPTETIAEEYDKQIIGNFKVSGRVLPVDYDRASAALLAHVDEVDPDVVILLGLAAGRHAITPERIAINVNDGVKDNAGRTPVDEPIEADGEDGYFSTLPIRAMVDALHDIGIPSSVSNSAGTYLCNHVMYRMLHHIKKNNLEMKAGFVHLPPSFELVLKEPGLTGWPMSTLFDGVKEIIHSLGGNHEWSQS